MNYDRLKSSVKSIEMSDDMQNRIIRNCHSIMDENTNSKTASQYGYRKPLKKRAVALVAAIAICITLSVPALAATIPAVYDLLYAVSPATAQFFKPVQMSCEDNGIRMEVISAYIDNDTAEIYIALQDLTGNRVDETTDLFDSYSINTTFDCSARCENVSYDEETRTATFLVSITQWDERKIEGDKITFRVKELLSNKQKYDSSLPEVDLSNLSFATDTQTVTDIRGGGGDRFKEFKDRLIALSPSDQQYSPVDGAMITAVGYIDGYLHAQVYFENIHETDNHGYVYFQNDIGEKIESIAGVSFWDSEQQGSYTEYIFEIPQEKIENYTMYGYFVTSNSLTEGNWEVTFPLESEISQ